MSGKMLRRLTWVSTVVACFCGCAAERGIARHVPLTSNTPAPEAGGRLEGKSAFSSMFVSHVPLDDSHPGRQPTMSPAPTMSQVPPLPRVPPLPSMPVVEPAKTTGTDHIALVAHTDVEPPTGLPEMPPQPLPAIDQMDFTASPDVIGGMTLDQFEALALSHNPTIRQLSASASKAQATRFQVERYPNPTVGYFGMQLGDAGTDQQGIFVEQQIVRGDKLALNSQVLGQAVQARLWDVESQRQRVLTDVRTRFYITLAVQRKRELTRRFRELAEQGVKLAELRKEALEASQIDVLQAKVQLNEMELAVRQAEAAYQGAWRDLAATAGMPHLEPAGVVGELKPALRRTDWEGTYQFLISNSPELATARAQVREAQARWRREEVQATPNVTMQLGAGIDNGTDEGMLNLQFGVPLPIFNNNDGNISAAYSEYCRATHEVKRIEMQLKARLARTTQDYESALAAVETYENDILPKAEETLTLADQAFQAGESSLLQVLIVRRTYFESNLRYVEATAELAQADAKIEGLLLTGALDRPDDFAGDDGLRSRSFDGQ